MATSSREGDPRYHTENVKSQLTGLMDQLREDIQKIDEPKAQALFETTAEVLGGLVHAFEHYEQAKPAWRRPA